MTIELDHLGLSVADYEAAKKFYTAALAPLRITPLMEISAGETGAQPVVGFGADGKPFLWLSGGGPTTHVHIAIRAENRAQIDAFYAAAIAAGGKDNGGPGVREMYHPNYYAAFILDADGHNIEAVCHADPKAATAKSTPARRAPAKRAAAKKPVARKRAAPAKKPASRSAAKVASRKAPKRAARTRKPAPKTRKGRR
jgi:catechol 2,3-dioxygenase-like lactoylglutathione lyase family enzyme